MEPLARMIRQQREARGLTLAQLAQAAGSTRSYLSMIENQRVTGPPSTDLLRRLEQALGLERDALVDCGNWQKTPPPVRQQMQRLADDARKGRALAEWLAESTSRRKGGGKNLDKLYRSGALKKRVREVLGDEGTPAASSTPPAQPPAVAPDNPVPRIAPLVNKVAAGYPSDFTDLDYPTRVADEYMPLPPDLTDPDAFALRVVGDSMLPDYREGDVVLFSPQVDVTDGSDCLARLEPDHQTTFKRIFFEPDDRIRLQPLNPRYAPATYPREEVAGLYRAMWRVSRV